MSGSIAFLDESGDESGKLQRGANPLFVVRLVVFTDPEEAAQCSERIDLLRSELQKPPRFEFHFRDNRHGDRGAFLAAVAPFSFTYHAVVIDKRARAGDTHVPLYLDAVARACGLAGESLSGSLLIVDAGEPARQSRRLIATAIRRRVNGETARQVLADVRPQESARNNLLQLADYVVGVASWSEQGKPGGDRYRRSLRAREGKYWRGKA